MKNIFTLLLLFMSIISFGQKSEYKKALKLAADKNYVEANILFEKLLKNEFGFLDNETHYDILLTCANSYEGLNEYKTSFDVWKKTIDFLKENRIHENDIEGIVIYMDKLKSKFPPESNLSGEVLTAVDYKASTENVLEANKTQEKATAIESEVINVVKNNTDISINKQIIINSEKTVNIITSGTGKNLEEAKNSALHSGIEQVFGIFISTKKEILNDNVIKDEVISVANGNILKYDVVSQFEVPNVSSSVTLNVIVSIDKLTSFAENKGIALEFKGATFAANIKLKKINEVAENKILLELFGTLHEKYQTSFDYLIESKDPVLNKDQINFDVPLKVSANCNQNFDLATDYLINVLKSISLDDSDLNNYVKLNKKTFKIKISYKGLDNIFNLRNELSYISLQKLFESWNFYLGCFIAENGVNVFQGPKGIHYKGDSSNNLFNEQISVPFISFNSNNYSENLEAEFSNGKIKGEEIINKTLESEFALDIKLPSYPTTAAVFEWLDFKTLEELEKIKNYTIKPSGITSRFKNGGYVIYEKNGVGIVACPFYIETKQVFNGNQNNNRNDTFEIISDKDLELWGNDENYSKLIGTGAKLFDGKINTKKIIENDKNKVGEIFQRFNYGDYNDWANPSADELLLVFSKYLLLGIQPDYHGYFFSSTEKQNVEVCSICRIRMIAFSFQQYYKKYMESFVNDKNQLIDKNFQFNYNECYGNKNNSYQIFQPIRYFKSE